MFQRINNAAYIDGQKGYYNAKVANTSVAYGRNAINNYKGYIASFQASPVQMPELKGLSVLSKDEFDKEVKAFDSALAQMEAQKMPPVDFSCRYMPTQQIDTDALLGAAYEEMGTLALPVSTMTKILQDTADTILGKDKVQMTAQSLDVNNDGNIDIGEYSATILAQDALSTDNHILDTRNINGVFTNKGENTLLAYGNKVNYEIASATFNGIYQMYGLNKAQNNFLSNMSNLQ